ncbi:MAG TPA: hypothetical protein VEA41_02560, partial [Salinarimonas sp.]|nr:hypothetical protein [Salinarimonas sp.]
MANHPGTCRAAIVAAALTVAASASAQEPGGSTTQHHHAAEGAGATLFEAREASGTAWLPAASPMYGVHREFKGWSLMLHGNAFAQYLYESGGDHRRGQQAGSINWLMAMGRRPLGLGRVTLRMMTSLEPWTLSGCGYPNLLATGEMCDGDTIHDRQHPHDLFMEVASEYDRPLAGS